MWHIHNTHKGKDIKHDNLFVTCQMNINIIMIIILRKLYSMINESNICHLISGQHRQHITNYVILHVFQQQRYMISALQEHARKAPQPADAALVEMTANYLQACHLIFQKEITNKYLKISKRDFHSLRIGH